MLARETEGRRMITDEQLEYVRWQNRSVDFYVGARALYLQGMGKPAVYCAATALEVLMKATLKYDNLSFNPYGPGHDLQKLADLVNGATTPSQKITIQNYFSNKGDFHTQSRYPHKERGGFLVPGSFLDDLDLLFANLLFLVDFHHNTELVRILANINGRHRVQLNALRKRNRQMPSLRKGLYRWTPPFPKKGPIAG